jgi:3-phenylpropionate/trans-cinnamate dioxygenase ferredoxin reductase subunit
METSSQVKYLIVGGGVASAHAAVGIRDLDADGSVMIVGQEPRLPYDRPPLSKGMLLGKADPEDAESKDPSFYTDNGIEVRRGVRALRVDRPARTVTLSDGTSVAYENLLLATGAEPKRPDLPGVNLPGVHLLRKVDDSLAIRDALGSAKTTVMVGAGYIGTEVADRCLERGVAVTLIEPSDHPWSKFASPVTGGYLQRYLEGRGGKFLKDEVAAFEGEGRVQRVRTKGGQVLEADLVVVGVGVSLNLDLAKEAGLEIDGKHGVVVDETLRTADPHVWVAGDIAAFFDSTIGKRWHAEHYLNGKWQGRQVGRNMAGAGEPYRRVPYFFSDMVATHMVLRGDPQGGKSAKVIGDPEAGEYVELYAREDGTLAMGLAFSADEKKLDPLADKLEELVLQRPKVEELTAESVGG